MCIIRYRAKESIYKRESSHIDAAKNFAKNDILYVVRNLLDNYKMKYETIEGEEFIFKIQFN